jgi:hypothetical protein
LKYAKDSKTTYTILKPEVRVAPNIVFSSTSIRWMQALVDAHQDEIGWFGIVDERSDKSYFIRDIFYPKHQEANSATCEISPEGEALMAAWLLDHGRESDLSKVRLWGHSHHNMGVSPSSQDDIQSMEKIERNKSYLIRVICNKSHEMSVSFYDYVNQVRFDNIKWSVEDDVPDEIYNEKVSKIIELLTQNNGKRKEQFYEIIKLIQNESDIDNRILAKVEELKRTNLPIKNSYTYGAREELRSQGAPSNQGGCFSEKREEEKGKEKENQNRSNRFVYSNSVTNVDPLMSDEEIEDIITSTYLHWNKHGL